MSTLSYDLEDQKEIRLSTYTVDSTLKETKTKFNSFSNMNRSPVTSPKANRSTNRSIVSSAWFPDLENMIGPTVIDSSGHYEDEVANRVLDNDPDTIWNAGHISGWDEPNWIVFDFEQCNIVA